MSVLTVGAGLLLGYRLHYHVCMVEARGSTTGGLRAGDAVRALLARRAVVRSGGVSLILAGVMGVFVDLLFVWLMGDPVWAGPARGMGWFWALSESLGLLGEGLILIGMAGLYALLVERRGLVGILAKVGFLLVAVSTVGYIGFWVREFLVQSSYFPAEGVSLQTVAFFVYSFVKPAGYLLLGVAALWIRALGRLRGLLLVAAFMSTPLPNLLLFGLIYSEGAVGPGTVRDFFVFQAPQMLADLGWILLGLTMWGAVRREEVLLAGDRRLIERRNLERARRLYEEAWDGGDLGVVDELASPDLFDAYRGEKGGEAFKRGIADLRRSFPDLRFEILDQRAEGDEVVTDWETSGTDRGGVLWYPPTGKQATLSGTFTDRFSAGRVVEHRGESGMEDLLEQLGLPRPG